MLSISMIIPLYQGERFIAEAVASALEQEGPPAWIIVFDDGSTDGGPAIVRGMPGVICLGQSNRGPAAAQDAGMAAASGDMLAWTTSCICCRRQVFQDLGRFVEGLKATSDLEWFRAFRSHSLTFVEIPETLVDRRVHAGAQSGDAGTISSEILEFARRAAAANCSGVWR